MSIYKYFYLFVYVGMDLPSMCRLIGTKKQFPNVVVPMYIPSSSK